MKKAPDESNAVSSYRQREPEQMVFQACYAPVDLEQMLAHSETRSKIRRLPAHQLYFAMQELADSDIQQLLPHITEEQWRTVLDLDVWHRDEMNTGQFLQQNRHLLTTEDPIARKLLRATDGAQWELVFHRDLKVFRRESEDLFEGEAEVGEETLVTPDQDYLIVLPSNPEKARLVRLLLNRLFELDPDWTRTRLESSLWETSIELEELLYQEKKLRLEDLGFQDYFDAIEIYGYLPQDSDLPLKSPALREISQLPVSWTEQQTGLIFLQALAQIEEPAELQSILEELFFVSNKILSADSIPPSSPDRLKIGIRKALTGLSLGLDVWSGANLTAAVSGLKQHYLQSFFQLGHSRLIDLQKKTGRLLDAGYRSEDAFELRFLEALMRRYPLRTVRTPKGLRSRFFRTRDDLLRVEKTLDRMASSD